MAAPIGIQTNVGSLVAQGNLAVTSRNLQSSISKLSSGIRVQSAADDAAGVAVAEGLNATVRGFQQAQRNANDGIAMLQTAEGSYQVVSDIMTRMRELAVQGASGTLADDERSYINDEYDVEGLQRDFLTRVQRLVDNQGGRLRK